MGTVHELLRIQPHRHLDVRGVQTLRPYLGTGEQLPHSCVEHALRRGNRRSGAGRRGVGLRRPPRFSVHQVQDPHAKPVHHSGRDVDDGVGHRLLDTVRVERRRQRVAQRARLQLGAVAQRPVLGEDFGRHGADLEADGHRNPAVPRGSPGDSKTPLSSGESRRCGKAPAVSLHHLTAVAPDNGRRRHPHDLLHASDVRDAVRAHARWPGQILDVDSATPLPRGVFTLQTRVGGGDGDDSRRDALGDNDTPIQIRINQ